MPEGGCHCGAVRYVAEGPAERSSLCHCADCRRCAGAPVMAWATWPAQAFRVTKGEAAAYASSEPVRRYFCAACGTGLYYVAEGHMGDKVDVQTATLDDPDAAAPTLQLQTAERIGWMATAHALPAYERWPPEA